MKTIDFKEFSLPLGISQSRAKVIDAREGFADLVYTNINGIAAHSLAFKIYRSEGPTEYTDGEADIIRRVAESLATPAFIDGLKKQIDNQP